MASAQKIIIEPVLSLTPDKQLVDPCPEETEIKVLQTAEDVVDLAPHHSHPTGDNDLTSWEPQKKCFL